MSRHPQGLARLRAGAGTTIVVAALMLGLALALPTVRFKRLASEEEIYSILGGINSLWQDGNFILAAIVFVFSVAYPIAKLLTLCALWLGWSARQRRTALIDWLLLLGKWSLLDVFIIALFVGAIQLGFLAEAESRAGIHVFFLAVVLSILATHLVRGMDQQREQENPHATPSPEALRNLFGRLLSLLTAGVCAAALWLPLMEVRKAFFFRNEVALPATTARLMRDGEPVLAAYLALLVMATSAAKALLLLRVRFLPGAATRALRWIAWLDEWSMIDVFGLGMLIVYVKLEELAAITRMNGFWVLIAAAVLSNFDSRSVRRHLARPNACRAAEPCSLLAKVQS